MSDIEWFAREFDVAICGGGLAGLALARQLRLRMPDLSVVVIEKIRGPLPDATVKVGESSVETGAFYLGEVLQLGDYFKKAQLKKNGLRYFFGGGGQPFHQRSEFGLSHFPEVWTYQIDRGILENDLRRLIQEAGVTLLEGYGVSDIVLSIDDAPHQVLYQTDTKAPAQGLRARWVVDATGRRRIIQKKLKLHREQGKHCNSAWWRLAGRIDVSDLVGPEQVEWHARVPGRTRYYSTTHLMDDGYWFWLIALSSGNTSVGIVALEDLHPFEEYNTYPRALEWLHRHEPEAWAYVKDREPLDFLTRRKYTYGSRQVYSPQRWACVGEAGVFSDPYYSPGNDFIGFGNTIVTEMVRRDRQGELTPAMVKEFNFYFLGLNQWVTHNIHAGYPLFGDPVVIAAKSMWDFCSAWGFVTPQMYNAVVIDPERHAAFRHASQDFLSLALRMQRLFGQWHRRRPGRLTYQFIDYLSLPFLRALRDRNLRPGKTTAELTTDQEENMRCSEEFAQILFLIALEDVMPEALAELPSPLWLNPWAASLDRAEWERDGLFQPTSAPRDLQPLWREIRGQFHLANTVTIGERRPTAAVAGGSEPESPPA